MDEIQYPQSVYYCGVGVIRVIRDITSKRVLDLEANVVVHWYMQHVPRDPW